MIDKSQSIASATAGASDVVVNASGAGNAVVTTTLIGGLHQYKNKPDRGECLGPQIADKIDSIWANNISAKLEYAVGGQWIGEIVSVYSKCKPKLIVDNNYSINSWLGKNYLELKGYIVVSVNDIDDIDGVIKSRVISVPYNRPYQDVKVYLHWTTIK